MPPAIPPFDAIAFDGDDTLWHNESLFSMTQERFRALITAHAGGLPAEDLDRRLLEAETRNLKYFGYGIKGFVLSMIETAVEVTEGAIPAHDIRALIDFGKAMLEHPVHLLDGVAEVVTALAADRPLLLITKGDLFDQESKVARSGLAAHFRAVEVVSEKDPATYARVLARHGVAPERFLMVGNSVKSDILPVLALGGQAVHIPYHLTWAHEVAEAPAAGYRRLDSLHGLPDLLAGWI
ncbi:putative hydrolase of the HAD superfamily [Azospirillum fermentarium]|uniref:HAD family hydrolase n=1 Tax=Azospirillum fermentarium TaxID=1233114 RepID=UPI0022272B97|nr:HAD family hydrolase [Azospirillum fermentarium]MCW2245609.1 putative hydrolase of the HAD superfamily [Azospirillum fermentarium]